MLVCRAEKGRGAAAVAVAERGRWAERGAGWRRRSGRAKIDARRRQGCAARPLSPQVRQGRGPGMSCGGQRPHFRRGRRAGREGARCREMMRVENAATRRDPLSHFSSLRRRAAPGTHPDHASPPLGCVVRPLKPPPAGSEKKLERNAGGPGRPPVAHPRPRRGRRGAPPSHALPPAPARRTATASTPSGQQNARRPPRQRPGQPAHGRGTGGLRPFPRRLNPGPSRGRRADRSGMARPVLPRLALRVHDAGAAHGARRAAPGRVRGGVGPAGGR